MPASGDGTQNGAELGGFAGVQTGGGFVEQQQPRRAGEGPGDLEQALGPGGQVGAGGVTEPAQSDDIEYLVGTFGECAGLLAGPGQAQAVGEEAGAGHVVGAEHDVLMGAQPRDEPGGLEGAHQSQAGELVRREGEDVAAGEAGACRHRAR